MTAGSKTWLNENMDAPVSGEFPGGRFCFISSVSPTKPTPNEDSGFFFWQDGCCIAAVADGAGGHSAGDKASRLLLEETLKTIEQANIEDVREIQHTLVDGILNGHKRVRKMRKGAATTFSGFSWVPPMVNFFQVGDSMALVTSARGKLKHLTVAHSPSGYAVASGLLDPSDAIHQPMRHLVSNMVGFADLRVEMGPQLKLAKRDRILLASDGLFDNLLVEEVVHGMMNASIEQVVKNLYEVARVRMLNPSPEHPSKPDDLTLFLFQQY